MKKLEILFILTAILVAASMISKIKYRINKNQKMVYEEFDRLNQHLKKILAD